jgi:hypothetical protein
MPKKTVVVTIKRTPAATTRKAVRKGAKTKTIDVKNVKGVRKLDRKDTVFAAGAAGTRGQGRSATSL